MVTAVPVVNTDTPPCPALRPVPVAPPPPIAEATLPITNSKRQRDGSPKEVMADGMQPGLLTQVFTVPSPGTSGMASSISDMSMSVGTPAVGTRTKATPKTYARRATNGRGKKMASSGTGEKRRPTMKVGARVVVERRHLNLRVLPHDPGRIVLDQQSHRNHNYFGVCVRKKDHRVYLIKFDLFPADAAPVPISWEHIKRVLHKDEEEPPNDRPEEEITEEDDVVENTATPKFHGKRNYAAESVKAFMAMDATGIKLAKSFQLRYGVKDSDVISWQILREDEQIVTCPMEEKVSGMTVSTPGARVVGHPEQLKVNPFKEDIDIEWNLDPNKVDYNKVFLTRFFPPLKGKAQVADRILSDPRCGIYSMVHGNKMQPFHQPDRDDPDEKVRTVMA